MIRKGVKFGLLFFVMITIWKWIFRPEIPWLENISISIAVFLIYIFIEWANKPHDWNKDKNKFMK